MEGVYIVDLLPGAANLPDFIVPRKRFKYRFDSNYQALFHSRNRASRMICTAESERLCLSKIAKQPESRPHMKTETVLPHPAPPEQASHNSMRTTSNIKKKAVISGRS